MTNTIEAVSQMIATKKAEAEREFKRLIHESARGAAVDPKHLMTTLEASGHTFEEFKEKVSHKRDRLALAAKVAEEPNLQRRREEAAAKIQENDARLEALRQEVGQENQRHLLAMQQADAALSQVSAARDELYRTCSDPEILHRAERVMYALRENEAALKKARDEQSMYQDRVGNNRYHEDQQKLSSEAVARLTAKIDELRIERERLLARNQEIVRMRHQP